VYSFLLIFFINIQRIFKFEKSVFFISAGVYAWFYAARPATGTPGNIREQPIRCDYLHKNRLQYRIMHTENAEEAIYMAEDISWASLELLEQFMREVFTRIGIPPEDARVCAEVLIESDRRGIDSHGISRFKHIYIDRIRNGIINPVTSIEVVKQGPTTAVIDGHNGMGQVIAKKSMQMAVDKARQYGTGMVVVRNSNHFGIAGYYALMAVKNNMIGLVGTNARPSVAPTFGVENMLGTNPLTVGLPTDEPFPFVLDCASSITQRGKVEVLARLGQALPPGLVIDKNGRSKTDSVRVLDDLISGEAALVPLGGIGEETGGYKGYGYSTFVEILSAALQNGAFLKALSGFKDGEKTTYKLGHFFMAVDISAFIEPDQFKKTAGTILRQLRASKKMPGQERIYTAGEKEYEAFLQRTRRGVPLDPGIQKQILQLKREFGLDEYVFPFEKKS
jgi:L-2-hydroxycarboxylate dehydrogenase (NAD+)